MSFNREEERKKAYEFVEQSLGHEVNMTKREMVQRAISIAMDELDELDAELHKFLERVQHLHVFSDLIKQPFLQQVNSMLQQAKYMMEKEYTQEELDAMPEQVYNQIVEIQKKRVEVLKKIAKSYFSK
jgi:hypothetical protein